MILASSKNWTRIHTQTPRIRTESFQYNDNNNNIKNNTKITTQLTNFDKIQGDLFLVLNVKWQIGHLNLTALHFSEVATME